MDNYITPQELYTRYPIFETNSSMAVNSDTIFYAAREVESKLAQAFTIPFSEDGRTFPTIKDLVIETTLVRYYRLTEPKIGEKLSDQLEKRFERIIKGEEYIVKDNGDFLEPDFSSKDEKIPGSTTENYLPTHTMLGAEHVETEIDPDRIEDL